MHSIAVRRSSDHGASWGDVKFINGPAGAMVGNALKHWNLNGEQSKHKKAANFEEPTCKRTLML